MTGFFPCAMWDIMFHLSTLTTHTRLLRRQDPLLGPFQEKLRLGQGQLVVIAPGLVSVDVRGARKDGEWLECG